MAEETSLVIDPGFFSPDWTLVRVDGRYARYAALASGSSLLAVSQLLETARKLIGKDYGKMPTVTQLDSCLQNGRETLFAFHQEIILKPFYELAACRTFHVCGIIV